jgi:hypothetical protein
MQFNIGHLDAVSGAQADLKAAGWDGVLLGGNYVAGAWPPPPAAAAAA